MKIQIYGTGCPKCKQLTANAQTAAAEFGLPVELEKVTDLDKIMADGILMTPALAVEGQIVSVGKVLSPDEIRPLLQKAAAAQPTATESPESDPTCCCEKAQDDKAAGPSCCCGSQPKETEKTAAAPDTCCCCSGASHGKKALTVLLLIFVAVSLCFVIARELIAKKAAEAATSAIPAAVAPAAAAPVLKVYYFHGTQRCMTCNQIEKLARAAIQEKFGVELQSGRLVFTSVNVDEPANEHFIRDFELSSKVVVMEQNGKYEKFDQVWTLVRQPEQFAAYLQDGARKMMEDKHE